MCLTGTHHRRRYLLFYVAAEEKVRLHNNPTDGTTTPGDSPSRRIFDRLVERRSGGGHKPKFDAWLETWLETWLERGCGLRQTGGRVLARCLGKIVQLPMGCRIARTATDHQQDRVFRRHGGERRQGLVASLQRDRQDVGMTSQGIALPHNKPSPCSTLADRLRNILSGVPCREQQERGGHDLRTAPLSQALERLANRGADHLQKAQFHGHIWQHLRHQCRNLPSLLCPHRVGRSMPHDRHAPRSSTPPRTGMGSLVARGCRPADPARPNHLTREPAKEPAKRAFHQATNDTGGQEWQGVGFRKAADGWECRSGERPSSILDQSNL